jgi:hypothetical protein
MTLSISAREACFRIETIIGLSPSQIACSGAAGMKKPTRRSRVGVAEFQVPCDRLKFNRPRPSGGRDQYAPLNRKPN